MWGTGRANENVEHSCSRCLPSAIPRLSHFILTATLSGDAIRILFYRGGNRPREVKKLAQRYTDSEWWGQDLNPGNLVPENCFSPPPLHQRAKAMQSLQVEVEGPGGEEGGRGPGLGDAHIRDHVI